MRKIKNLPKPPFPMPDVVTKVVPAPTDGWDAISPLANMDPKRAPILINWVPRPGWVELRAGFTPYVYLGSSIPVETLLVRRALGAEKMFAAAGGNIWDINTPSVPSKVVTGLGSNRWQYTNFTPSGGTTVIQLANGTDPLTQYDGTSWTQPSITGFPGALTTSNITNIYAQKTRLWYLFGGTTIAAYMPVNAISGAITGFQDFGNLWNKGGTILAMVDWTIDGGSGPQDYAAFISNQGQISLYAGTDPSNANAWSLVGTFNVATPIGKRCVYALGSDVAIITMQGLVLLSQALPFDPSSDRSASLTSRIQNAMVQFSQQGQNNFGWQTITYPSQQLLFLNVPLVENSQQIQCVMNMLTGAWTQFQGWSSNCFELFNQVLYFGDNSGNINLAYSSAEDGGAAIASDMQCAFNYFDDPGRIKRVTMVQPLLTASGQVTPFIEIDVDFQTSNAASPIVIITGSALWDSAVWDVAVWPQPTVAVTNWLSAEALGHALAVRLKLTLGSNAAVGEFDIGVFDTAEFDIGIGAAPTLQVNAFNIILEMGGYN